jgi:hypothetical protein
MEYLGQNTTIPVPHIHSWGFTSESPQQFGPFIIMDYIEGTLLSTVLKQPMKTDQEDVVLDPSINNSMLTRSTVKSPITLFSFLNLRLPALEPSRRTVTRGPSPKDH